MNAFAIRIVTQALKDAIAGALPPGNAAHPDRVYVGPLDDANARDADLVLFLYRIAVNAELRNAPHTAQAMSANGLAVVYERSLPLDLHYLLTVGPNASNNELGGLDLLGTAIQALNGTPFLVGSGVRGETVRITLDPVSNDEMGRIWTLFPAANFRTSVTYVVTPVWIDPASEETVGTPVVEEPHRIGQTPATESAA